jgi:predicted amidohydrolase
VGEERGFRFIGGSRVCDPSGATLAAASATEEVVLLADVDASRARQKRLVRVPGKHEIDRIRDRRPEFYSRITNPKSSAHSEAKT